MTVEELATFDACSKDPKEAVAFWIVIHEEYVGTTSERLREKIGFPITLSDG